MPFIPRPDPQTHPKLAFVSTAIFVAVMMANPEAPDNHIDICGYASLAGEMATETDQD